MSSSDDGTTRLSKTLDDVRGRSTTQEWSVDDTRSIDEGDATVAPADGASNGGRATPSARADGEPAPGRWPDPPATTADDSEHGLDIPAGADGAFVLPEIVPATSDAPEPSPEPPRARTTGVPITVPPAPTAAPTPSPRPAPVWNQRTVPSSPSGSLRTPSRRPRVRRVTRVLRHIDPWSTFKLALLFSLVAYVTALTSGVLLWRVADSTGTLDNVERWFTQFGWETFEFQGGEIFHNAWIIGLFGVVAATGGAVLVATLFNLVSDIVGGVRLTVLEEEVVERTVSANRRYVVRRPAMIDHATGTSGEWDLDDDANADGPTARRPPPPPPTSGQTAAADWSVDDDPSGG